MATMPFQIIQALRPFVLQDYVKGTFTLMCANSGWRGVEPFWHRRRFTLHPFHVMEPLSAFFDRLFSFPDC